MTLMNKLRADNLTARKNKDQVAASLLTTLVSEATMVGKNAGNRETTDEEALRVVKKFLDNAKETYNLLGESKNGDAIVNVLTEISILESYMPEQLTPDALKALIVTFKNENPDANMGAVMKHLQKYYTGCYDGKLASQIAKEVF